MHAAPLLQNSLRKSLDFVHAGRWAALWSAVDALLHGERLTLTALGRAARGESHTKHQIKKMCRLLGNEKLHDELGSFASGIAAFALRRVARPVILVDWTPMGNKSERHALVASTTVAGRSAILYCEVHPEKKMGSRKVENAFLKNLSEVVPKGCVPTIITDAGFRTPWFDEVRALGWHYLGRLRGQILVQATADKPWVKIKSLFSWATRIPKDLGTMILTRSSPRENRLVIVSAKPSGKAKKVRKAKKRRTKPRRDYKGSTDRPHQRERHKRAAQEPWLLATSLSNTSAKRIVKLYKLRMQIEETFRDLKSQRFGWSFDESRTSNERRIEVLLLIAALASLVLLLLGIAGEKALLHRRLQANTRDRRVLSLITLARELLASGLHKLLTSQNVREARDLLTGMVRTQAELVAA